MTVVSEINQLIETLASRLPGSMENPENKKLEIEFKKSLANYFDSLSDAFPFQNLEAILKVKEVAPPRPKAPAAGEWDEWIDALIKSFQGQFEHSLFGHLVTIYYQGSVQMTSWGRTKQLKLPILYEGPPIQQAIDWARDYGAKMVTKMNEETKRQLAQVIADGVENKRGIDGITRDIKKVFTDMSRDRADMIAQTETNMALSQASMDRMTDMGVDGKEWIPIGDDRLCDICQGNAAQGIIPINQSFQSGHMNTPGHPRCRCATAPAMLYNRKK